jgi:hypothetical protein
MKLLMPVFHGLALVMINIADPVRVSGVHRSSPG